MSLRDKPHGAVEDNKRREASNETGLRRSGTKAEKERREEEKKNFPCLDTEMLS